jgi:hypothetical protein
MEHSFAGEPSDGTNPFGRLTEAGGLIHGTALRGGTRNRGILFTLKP